MESTGTPFEVSELNSAVRAFEVKGQRLPDAVLAFSGVEAHGDRSGRGTFTDALLFCSLVNPIDRTRIEILSHF